MNCVGRTIRARDPPILPIVLRDGARTENLGGQVVAPSDLPKLPPLPASATPAMLKKRN